MEDNQKITENTDQQVGTQHQGDVDYKALYRAEVDNSKQLRKRAQEREAEIKEIKKSAEEDDLKKLKSKEKYKTLSDELQKKLDAVTPFKEKWEQYEDTRREFLLNKVPEDDRGQLESLELNSLEYVVSKLSESKPANPDAVVNSIRNKDIPDNPFALPKGERKKVWADYVKQFNKNLGV